MPYDMQKIIMISVMPKDFEDNNPSPFTTIVPKEEHRKSFKTMYGGLFTEVFEKKEFETYGHFTFNTITNKITKTDTTAQTDFLIDPVAFAYDFGARMYDARLGIFTSIDPHASKYPSMSPYSAMANNPIIYVDPDGRDAYLVIWATSDGNVGHAAIAVDNYRKIETKSIENGVEMLKTTYEKDGTVTYYDLWPNVEGGVGVMNSGKDVNPLYQKITIGSVDDLLNTDPSKGEGVTPDGVVKIKTAGFEADKITKEMLEKLALGKKSYNGRDNNCSDYAEQGVESASGKTIMADEKILGKSSTTPNMLYKETIKLPNTEVLKDPEEAVEKTFIEGVKEKP